MKQSEILTASTVTAKTPSGVIGMPVTCEALYTIPMQESEIWKDIPGYEGMYQVSDFGQVKSLQRIITEKSTLKARPVRERILKQVASYKGYYFIHLSKNGAVKNVSVHRTIAKLFVPNPSSLPEVNHKDEIKANNYSGNLEWCSHLYNIRYGTGIVRKTKSQTGVPNIKNNGEGCGTSKLKRHQVLSIYSDPRKYKEISKEYGIVFSAISKIKHKRTWRVLLETI